MCAACALGSAETVRSSGQPVPVSPSGEPSRHSCAVIQFTCLPMPPVCLSLRSLGPTCKPIHVSSSSPLSSPLAGGRIIWSLTCSQCNHIREQGSVPIRDRSPPTGKHGKWSVGSAVAGIKRKAAFQILNFDVELLKDTRVWVVLLPMP